MVGTNNFYVGETGVLVHNAKCNGGGKNAKHANQKRREVAADRYEKAKSEYESLRSQPNKTKETKAAIDKAKRAMEKARKDKDFTGEHHSSNAKGNR